jgi:hypothetical protein
MGEVEYTNLRLSFKQRVDREYDVTAAIDGGSTTTSTFTIPMSDEALQEAILNLSETRSALAKPVTRKVTAVTQPGVTAQEFGTTLADALITGDVATMFDEARSKGAVRVRLEMTGEPELLRIPWEFLRRNGKDLASQRDCTVVRELATSEPVRPHVVEGKIRMLGVIANPLRDLDVAGEKQRVSEALEKCKDQVELEWLEDCTFKSLQRILQKGTYHILHFVGHSAFTADGESIVLLSDENGMAKQQSADSIAQLIGRHESLQLVVFNSCDGARTKVDDPFASIATMLVQQGKSAVIAMQFEITDAAAKAFAEELYFCLIDGHYPIDAAVAEARIAMLDVNQIEFATPVLFLRSGFVDLFEFKDAPVPTPLVLAPPSPPADTSDAGGLPPTPPAAPQTAASKRKRWPIYAGGGVLVAAAAVAGVVALSSDGDETAESTPVETTISGESYLPILRCIESDLFIPPYFDSTSPDSDGFGQCDEARQQLEADGLDAAPIYGAIVDRLTDGGSLSSMMQEGTDSPDDHQAFADNGDGLYEELRSELRTLRGLDPEGGVSFATELGDQVTDATAEVSEPTYEVIHDDTSTLNVEVPVEWGDIDTAPLTRDAATEGGFEWILGDNDEAPRIQASPSIADYSTDYSTPGLVFLALPFQSSLDDTLEVFAPLEGECTDAGIVDYDDGVYTGRYQTFTDCGGTSTVYITVAAVPSDDSFTAVVAIAAVSDADLVALDQILATFNVLPAASS